MRRAAALILLIVASVCSVFAAAKRMPLPPALLQGKRIYITTRHPTVLSVPIRLTRNCRSGADFKLLPTPRMLTSSSS